MDNILFTPIKINDLTIPNRFVRSATNDYYSHEDGSASEAQVHLYTELAKGEVGLIISGFIYIAENGKTARGQFGLYNKSQVSSYRKLADTVHKYGGFVFAQIVHGGRQVRPNYIKGEAFAPTEYDNVNLKFRAREMTEDDILKTINDFINTAVWCKEAGFDGVQLHGAHGYLLSEFFSPHANRRTDKWGGSTENRMRIAVEIINGIRKKVGNNYPLIIKLNGSDGGLENGLEIEESVKIAKELERLTIDAIEVSRGMIGSPEPAMKEEILSEKDEAYLLPLAEQVKKNVNVPVISVGGYRTLKIMENAVLQNKCDMVSLSRPFIREPDLVTKFREGKQKADCISCNKCSYPRGIRCYHLHKKEME